MASKHSRTTVPAISKFQKASTMMKRPRAMPVSGAILVLILQHTSHCSSNARLLASDEDSIRTTAPPIEKERAFLLEFKQSLDIATFGFRESDSCPESGLSPADTKHWSAIWSWSEDLSSACDFGGVVCDSDGHAVSIDLRCNGLKGTLPEEMATLSRLQNLQLDGNELSGTLPAAWSVIATIRHGISLTDNPAISGTLPPEWSKLQSCQSIQLNRCSLEGTLPSAWSVMSAMRSLRLDSNHLGYGDAFDPRYHRNDLPIEWSTWSRATVISLERNRLAGTIPVEFTGMASLEELQVAGNAITGLLPQEFSSLKRLKNIDLSNNVIVGELPSAFSSLEKLQHLNLGGNLLFGELPEEWMAMKELATMSLGSNRLRGGVPEVWFSSLNNLITLDLSDNQLSGGVMELLVSAVGSSVKQMDLHRNRLDGAFPLSSPWPSSKSVALQELDLRENYISGTAPDSLILTPGSSILLEPQRPLPVPDVVCYGLCTSDNHQQFMQNGAAGPASICEAPCSPPPPPPAPPPPPPPAPATPFLPPPPSQRDGPPLKLPADTPSAPPAPQDPIIPSGQETTYPPNATATAASLLAPPPPSMPSPPTKPTDTVRPDNTDDKYGLPDATALAFIPLVAGVLVLLLVGTWILESHFKAGGASNHGPGCFGEQRCTRGLSPSEALILAASSSALGLDIAAAVLFVRPLAPELAVAAAAAIASSVLLNGCILLAEAAATDGSGTQLGSLSSNASRTEMVEGRDPPAASIASCTKTCGGSCRSKYGRSLRMLIISLAGLIHPAAARQHVAGIFASAPAGVGAWRCCCQMLLSSRPPVGIVMVTGSAFRAVPMLVLILISGSRSEEALQRNITYSVALAYAAVLAEMSVLALSAMEATRMSSRLSRCFGASRTPVLAVHNDDDQSRSIGSPNDSLHGSGDCYSPRSYPPVGVDVITRSDPLGASGELVRSTYHENGCAAPSRLSTRQKRNSTALPGSLSNSVEGLLLGGSPASPPIIRQANDRQSPDPAMRLECHPAPHRAQYDVFLSHNWGPKGENHARVRRVHAALKRAGIRSWFDEERMAGNIHQQMASGIDDSSGVLAFVTNMYRDKVNNDSDFRDNCKFEFCHALNAKSCANMLAVVMEPGMRDCVQWRGLLGAALGARLYVDLCDIEQWDDDHLDAFVRTSLLPQMPWLNAPAARSDNSTFAQN